ncbi:MAG: hypothetical protein ACR2N9_10770 [Acidimicrobiia bacterium]
MNVEVVASIAAALFGALALFQIALALGAPAGEYVFGGRIATEEGRLPGSYRIGAAVAAVVLCAFALIILARAGVIETSLGERFLTIASWAVVAYMAINTAMNLAGKTKVERYGFSAVTGILVVLCSIVAASGPA